MEPITVTRDEIIYQRRVRVLEHAGETRNISLTRRTFGISRKTFYEWQTLAEDYGLDVDAQGPPSALGWPMHAVLSDNGPEYVATRFKDHLADLGLFHHRIPPRSPNHNAVCERFQRTALQECWRVAFHRRRFSTIRQLHVVCVADLASWWTMRMPFLPPPRSRARHD